MGDYNRVGFEKAFKKAVLNFDETKIWFEHKSKRIDPSKVCFVWKGRLWKCQMYKSQFEIDNWANHFINFLNTGEFDYNGYWKLYESILGTNATRFIDDKIYKFPLCKKYGNDCYTHSDEMNAFFKTEEGSKIGKQYGIKIVPKPLNK